MNTDKPVKVKTPKRNLLKEAQARGTGPFAWACAAQGTLVVMQHASGHVERYDAKGKERARWLARMWDMGMYKEVGHDR